MLNEDILISTTYKTYYAYASGAKEPKKARMFKKLASPKLKTVPVSPKEPTDSDDNDDNDDDDGNDDDGDHDDNDDDSDHERTESDRDENPNLNQSYEEHEKEEEEYVNEFNDEEDDDDYAKEETKEEIYDAEELYRDVNVNLRKEDVEITDVDQGGADQHNVSQDSGFEQVEEDARATLTAVHDTQKTEDRYIDNKQRESIQQAIKSHTAKCREEALADRREYIDLIITSVRAIIKEEVKTQLPQILLQAFLEFATPVIEQNVTESLEVAVLAKSSSQPKSTYEAAASLSESRENKDKDQDPSAGLDRGTKRRKSSKDTESSRGPKSKESKSTSTSKGTSRSQHKSSGKSTHAEEQSHTVDDLGVCQNQKFDMGNNDEQPDDETVSKSD
ncbi:hypothetical protein Tco_0955058 [Tanacetum coccineum]|uniref:Uncharacterized protein n=1 Tax=Tanacetum coccineum TaxID=301880 RepID=A0ABQ5E691_9ASTR